ncbi:hypothetical protein CNMCM6936_003635 [Aspergillus lentulus]|uniref:Utp8 beta-propeller domain-containing protein n=1 Tax=Aspergillus lentulus TaxID=293939 RepID=A0AAN5YE99_ASPLE|nr:hypothetical protein CNMCM6936_003635 [Aspergillus lentulus]KAF4199996.1 hypothetical protein CNMCM8927_004181 [Aspergillus lentulus]GFF69962.1 hypothetical protein IFM62136_07715 [Aspergillus lentulus]GFF70657.1 hypothetical protein IFM47457_02692 [Aspergillus lentulus]GFF78534.1 hypothetical protein IFM60648_05239 [Aspergillus lentulus]
MDLQPPSVLAQLPRPLHASTGKTQVGEVYSLADSKKRKRYEVVVAVDGEAVNIYNIQTPKLVTSYAVPPQSSFSCRPCSVRRKLTKKSVVKRQTFVAVDRPGREIKAFVEEIGGTGSSAPVISSSSFSVSDSSSPTVFVGIVPTAPTEDDEQDSFDVLTVHQDGLVRRLTSDLKTQRWSVNHTEISKLRSTHEVNSCFVVDFDDAKKYLFKRRQDLVAMALGDLTDSGVDEPSVLVLVSHPTGSKQIALSDVQVQIFSVPSNTPSEGRILDESQKLRHLQTITLPDIDEHKTFDGSSLQWYFHPGSAGLNLSFEKGFVNIDLSQYAPTVTTRFILEDESFSSLMRISPQSVIAAGKSIVALFDTQYQSIQRSIAVDSVPSGGSKSRTVFVSYFTKLGVAVAIKGNALFAFDLSSSISSLNSSLKRPRDGLLIDAIGRGIGSPAFQSDAPSKKNRTEYMASLGLTSAEHVSKWEEFTQKVEEYANSKDSAAFDDAVLDYFGVGSPKALPAAQHYVNPEMVLFLLSKIFSLREARNKDKLSATSDSCLTIGIWPEMTCRWLIQLGHFCLSSVEIALRRVQKPHILPPLPTGSFTQAVIDSDRSLHHFIDVLQGSVLLNADELAYALKVLLTMARSHSMVLEEATKSVTNDDENSSHTSKEVTLHNAEASLQDIFIGFNTTLQKIHNQPFPTIVSSFRSALSRSELLSIVHHLRLCLATGGYTSRFTENPPSPFSPEQTTPSLSLDTITNLLNAAVDAIGPSGWISAAGIDDASTRDLDLIADMKSEISAALAGVEEATYLKGILREYLRFTNSFAHLSAKGETGDVAKQAGSQETSSGLVRYEKLNGADLMVFGLPEGDEGYDIDASGKMLPLSLKAPTTDVSKTKVKKSTGEVKTRSSREIGYLRRKAAGKYSFERLLV